MLKYLVSACVTAMLCQPVLADLPGKDKLLDIRKKVESQLNYRKLISGSGKCLDINGPDLHKDGGKVQIWACSNNPPDNQLWRIDDQGHVVSKGGKCLEISAPDAAKDGGLMQVWTCADVPHQKWRLDEQGRLVNTAGGKCLDIHGPDLNVDGGKVQAWGCNDAPNQKWRFE